MKNTRLVILVSFLSLAVSLNAQDAKTSKKKTVAVLDFTSSGGVPAEEMKSLTNRFRGILVQTNAFNVIEREQMAQLLKEQDFTLTDMCNTNECAVQVGQMLGAEQMISGSIGKVGKVFTIDLKLIDVSTSKILQTQSKNYRGDSEGLLVIMKIVAKQFAGLKVDKKELDELETISQPKSSKIPWILAGTAIIGGGAATYLMLGKSSGDRKSSTGIIFPGWPNTP